MDVIKRKLKLVNKFEEEFDLLGSFSVAGTDSILGFLNEPDGFGFEIDIESERALDEDLLTKVEYKFGEISGELIFSSYANYDLFIAYFLRSQKTDEILFDNSNNLKLYYQTSTLNVESEYYYTIIIKNLEKGEKGNDDGLLKCNVTFQKLSHLRQDIVLTASNTSNVSPFFTFPLPTDGTDFIKFGSEFSNKIGFHIFNPSNLELPVKFSITGAYENPHFINISNGAEGGYFETEGDGVLEVDARNPQLILNNDVNAITSIDNLKRPNFLFLSSGVNDITFTIQENPSGSGLTIITLEYSLQFPTG